MQFPEPLDEFSAEDQRVVRDHMETVRFAAGECIFRQGSQGDGCFIVEQGEVRLEFADETHVETKCVLAHVTQGSLLGELAVLDGRPRSAAAFAETDVVAQYLSSVAVDQICSRHPQVGVGLMRALGRDASLKLRRSNERLADFIAVDTPDPEVDAMVARAAEAQREFEDWPEERVDALLLALAQAGAHHAEALAHATVKETRIGNVADKAIKNRNASLCVYESLAGKPGRGIVAVDADRRVTEIASPAGVVFGIVPVTAPVATAIFKTLIALKARCALILSFHRACLGVGNMVCELMARVLAQHGAPADLMQWVRKRSGRTKTMRFMRHPGVSLILATGGA